VSELVCGIETYVILGSTIALGGLHTLTSSLGMGVFALGLYQFFNRRFIGYAEPRCVVNRLCRGCTVGQPGGCRYTTLLMLGTGLAAAMTIPSFFVSTQALAPDPTKFVIPFASWNHWFDTVGLPSIRWLFPTFDPTAASFTYPSSILALKFHVLPAAALVVLVTGMALLRLGREATGLSAAVFAIGMVCFSYLEVVLYRVIGDAYIGGLGHELCELWFLIATAHFLSRTFPGIAADNRARNGIPQETTVAATGEEAASFEELR
jgi:cellulose synthase/poly-beta-1,6-N-acetylglucosamine synthase-like glycosyltransferase